MDLAKLDRYEQEDLDGLPQLLRTLLDAELAAGNELLAIEHRHPAAPCGALFRLANPLRTRPRDSGGGLHYRARNNSSHSGEITDEQGYFFLIEPPGPPEPPPDMDAIRAALDRREVENCAAFERPTLPKPPEDTPLRRFLGSMVMNYKKWHDGTGYDLEALHAASPHERTIIENILIPRAAEDWRDVEALAIIGTPAAHRALERAFREGSGEIRAAVLRYAPGSVR